MSGSPIRLSLLGSIFFNLGYFVMLQFDLSNYFNSGLYRLLGVTGTSGSFEQYFATDFPDVALFRFCLLEFHLHKM